MLAGGPAAERGRIADKVAAKALAVLLSPLWFGAYILNFFGVSLGALRIAGGLVVAVVHGAC